MHKRCPSPNFDERGSEAIDMLVLHYTGMKTAEEALTRMCDPAAKVSAHYMVDEDGSVHALVPEEKRAWHAGVSYWRGHTNINARSVGIEIVNPGHEFGYRPFPEAQMHAVISLCKNILSRHSIPARNAVGHSDVAPERKEDPGELFDWQWLAREGVGLWVRARSEEQRAKEYMPADIQQGLAEYGYHCPLTGEWDEHTRKVIIAFQRHFRPANLTGEWDGECISLLECLLEQA